MESHGIWQPIAVINTWPVSFRFYIAALLGLWTAGVLTYAAAEKRKKDLERPRPLR